MAATLSEEARSDRASELGANLARVRERVAAASASAGRDPSEVTIVVVTKTRPSSDVRILARLGVRDVGENRDQEAHTKAAECADLGLRWHFVGQVQTNKARSVATYADVVHSVDRERLVEALSEAAEARQRVVRCLVQVVLGTEPGVLGPRAGIAPRHAAGLADAIAAAPGLELAGVMGVAPLGAEPAPAFARLAEVADVVRSRHPGATIISAGMSGDLEAAIRAGATHVRVGTAVLGARPPLR
ncbi:MAG: YggS family pyridoxal phosphate-dependent enzyme [Actinomycetota bacterium]|nr:YggS family pyridoxal phosphate-dependent enzyme [Actinomycetota bacterium]